jgi:hypothetical protein
MCKKVIEARETIWALQCKTCPEDITAIVPNALFIGMTLIILITTRGWYSQKDLADEIRPGALAA